MIASQRSRGEGQGEGRSPMIRRIVVGTLVVLLFLVGGAYLYLRSSLPQVA